VKTATRGPYRTAEEEKANTAALKGSGLGEKGEWGGGKGGVKGATRKMSLQTESIRGKKGGELLRKAGRGGNGV